MRLKKSGCSELFQDFKLDLFVLQQRFLSPHRVCAHLIMGMAASWLWYKWHLLSAMSWLLPASCPVWHTYKWLLQVWLQVQRLLCRTRTLAAGAAHVALSELFPKGLKYYDYDVFSLKGKNKGTTQSFPSVPAWLCDELRSNRRMTLVTQVPWRVDEVPLVRPHMSLM